MSPHRETNETYHEESSATGSLDDRPPQLNMTVCGCRCGCGCNFNGDSEDASSEDEGAAFRMPQTFNAIPNMTSADVTFPHSSKRPESLLSTQSCKPRSPAAPRGRAQSQRIETPYSEFLMSEQGFHLIERSSSPEGFEHVFIRRDGHLLARTKTPNSMANEPCNNGDHSLASSGFLSVSCQTPGPGLGGWIEEIPITGYHFLKSPLRLTPQRRYCRGLVAAHLVLDDDMTFHDYPKSILEEDLRAGVDDGINY
ncbi:hypothetical protein AOQ84DRAFT_187888 [Glonium stellatum]|uniref:Uncharacterized protein n=1 Tax=Glonium stellatum TaxID=574774 RepID=A0A8E2EP72_9PEZI|nr:hypothetical protein AOQ84DRAFT_187888 [Glonium stellatum]